MPEDETEIGREIEAGLVEMVRALKAAVDCSPHTPATLGSDGQPMLLSTYTALVTAYSSLVALRGRR